MVAVGGVRNRDALAWRDGGITGGITGLPPGVAGVLGSGLVRSLAVVAGRGSVERDEEDLAQGVPASVVFWRVRLGCAGALGHGRTRVGGCSASWTVSVGCAAHLWRVQRGESRWPSGKAPVGVASGRGHKRGALGCCGLMYEVVYPPLDALHAGEGSNE